MIHQCPCGFATDDRLWLESHQARYILKRDHDVSGLTAGELERAKTRMVADAIYARDSQSDLARWYGSSLAIGQTLRDVEEWPARIERVGAEDVIGAARRWIDHKPAVTGYLMPLVEEAA